MAYNITAINDIGMRDDNNNSNNNNITYIIHIIYM